MYYLETRINKMTIPVQSRGNSWIATTMSV